MYAIRSKYVFTQFLATPGLPLPRNQILEGDNDWVDQEAVGFGVRNWEKTLQTVDERISNIGLGVLYLFWTILNLIVGFIWFWLVVLSHYFESDFKMWRFIFSNLMAWNSYYAYLIWLMNVNGIQINHDTEFKRPRISGCDMFMHLCIYHTRKDASCMHFRKLKLKDLIHIPDLTSSPSCPLALICFTSIRYINTHQ